MNVIDEEKLDAFQIKMLDKVNDIMRKVADELQKFYAENHLDAQATVEFSGSFIISMTTTIIMNMFNEKAGLKDKLVFAEDMCEGVKKNLMHYSKKYNEKLNL